MARRWYVIQVRPGDEALALKNLTNQDFRPFLPLIRVQRGKLIVKTSMFGNYMFVELDRDNERWQAVWSTRGVIRMLGASAQKPTPLREGVVEALIQVQENNEFGVVIDFGPRLNGRLDPLSDNAPVQILNGPMAGYAGLVAADQGARVRVLLSLFGREREIIVERKNLREIDDRQESA